MGLNTQKIDTIKSNFNKEYKNDLTYSKIFIPILDELKVLGISDDSVVKSFNEILSLIEKEKDESKVRDYMMQLKKRIYEFKQGKTFINSEASKGASELGGRIPKFEIKKKEVRSESNQSGGNLQDVENKELNNIDLISRVNEIKAINLDFDLEFKNWNSFRQELLNNINSKNLSEKEKEGLIKFIDTEIKFSVTSMLDGVKEISMSGLGVSLDSLLDDILNSQPNENGQIVVNLKQSSLEIIKGVWHYLTKDIDFIDSNPAVKFTGNNIIFESKEDAINIIGALKLSIFNFKSGVNHFFDSVESVIESFLAGTLAIVGTLGGSLILAIEKMWLGLLQEDWNFIMEHPVLGVLLNGFLFYALSRSLQFSKTGVDTKVFNRLNTSFENLKNLYSNNGLEEESENIKKVLDNLSNAHDETSSGMLDNYKKVGKTYQLLQGWRGNFVGDSFHNVFAYIGDFLDNGALIDGRNAPLIGRFFGKSEYNSILLKYPAFIKDISLLPFKLGFIYLNRGPDGGLLGWKFRNKGLIIQDFAEANEKAYKKFDTIFGRLDEIQKSSNSKITTDEIKKLKKSILLEYSSNIPGAKLDPLKQNKIQMEGKIPKRVDIDKLTIDKIGEFLKSKFGDSDSYKKLFSGLLQELKRGTLDFSKIEQEIKSKKLIIDDFLKYSPEISPDLEKVLLDRSNIIANLSKNGNVFVDELLSDLTYKGIIIDFSEIEKRVKEFKSLSVELDTNKLENIRKKLLGFGINYDEVNNFINYLKNNNTYWEPHLMKLIQNFEQTKKFQDFIKLTKSQNLNFSEIDSFRKNGFTRFNDFISSLGNPQSTSNSQPNNSPQQKQTVDTERKLTVKEKRKILYEKLDILEAFINLSGGTEDKINSKIAKLDEIRTDLLKRGALTNVSDLDSKLSDLLKGKGFLGPIYTLNDLKLHIETNFKSNIIGYDSVKFKKISSFYDLQNIFSIELKKVRI